MPGGGFSSGLSSRLLSVPWRPKRHPVKTGNTISDFEEKKKQNNSA